jgi:preprotein translocase subunit SecA
LREQVAFSGYAQRDPLIEYQDQGFRRFQILLNNISSTIVRTLLQADFAQFKPQAMVVMEGDESTIENLHTNADEIAAELEGTAPIATVGVREPMGTGAKPMVRPAQGGAGVAQQKIGRNDLCFCGSGKKFKKCHGKNA